MEIARRIRKLRLQNALSLAEVAMRADVGACFLARLEDGKEVPSWEAVERLAAALNVPVSQLFYSDSQPPLTPRLTRRLTMQEVAAEPSPRRPDESDQPPNFPPNGYRLAISRACGTSF